MAKRPSGFGKASKLKKQKSENVPDNAAAGPSEEPEVNIELQDETADDELAEVYGLYTKLREERDPRIARGLVHESDQLLRSRDAKGETLPAKFHVAYAAALLTLADPSLEEKEHTEFGKAGIERLQVGLDAADNAAVDVRALAASELVQYVHTQIQDGSISKANKKHIKKAQELLDTKETNLELARAGLYLVQLADDCADEEKLAETARKVLQQQLDSTDAETKRVAHEGLGQYYLNVVAPAIDALEDEEEDDDDDENSDDENENAANASIKADLKAALDNLKLAVTEAVPRTFVMLAETLLQWANFVDAAEEEQVYAEALAHLKRAQMLGAENLREVIESLENPEE